MNKASSERKDAVEAFQKKEKIEKMQLHSVPRRQRLNFPSFFFSWQNTRPALFFVSLRRVLASMAEPWLAAAWAVRVQRFRFHVSVCRAVGAVTFGALPILRVRSRADELEELRQRLFPFVLSHDECKGSGHLWEIPTRFNAPFRLGKIYRIGLSRECLRVCLDRRV